MSFNRFNRRLRGAAPILTFLLVFSQLSGRGRLDSAQIQLAVDTVDTGQQGLLSIFGGVVTGSRIGEPVGAADVNGDGNADVVFCEMYASLGSRINNGRVNVYLSNGEESGVVDAAMAPPTVTTLIGQGTGDLLGTAVATGDVNGDGLSDIVVSAVGNQGPHGLFNAGAVYVIPGSKNFVLNADLFQTTSSGAPPLGITAIYGPQVSGRFGEWLAVADVDGDGIPDIVAGMDEMNSSTGSHVGGAYIIFGSKNLPQVIDLTAPPPGARITKIVGVSSGDHWGGTVHAGDIDNDGIADVVISGAINRDSAVYVSPGDFTGSAVGGASDGGLRPMCGEAYVLYGSANWPAEIDLANPPAGSTHLIGANAGDFFGTQLFNADLNGDGKTDLIVGGLQALAPDAGAGRPGAVYVIYGGGPSLRGATIDMASPNASGQQIAIIYGQQNLGCTGDSVRAYDINNDGMADLFIGSPESELIVNGQDRVGSGCVDLVFGQAGFLPPVTKFYEPPLPFPVYRLAGGHGIAQDVNGTDDEGDEFGYRLAAADVNGDGFLDFVCSAQGGDGFNNTLTEAGNVYVFSGRHLSEQLGMLPSAPVLQQATLSANGAVVAQAPAGQTGLTVTVTGTGFSDTSQFTINTSPVTFTLSPNPPAGSEQAIINLDQNLPIRNSIGPLVVQAQNTVPPSAVSNSITAGTLSGPQITSVVAVPKAGGKILLKVFGQGFKRGDLVSVTDAQGMVPTKAVTFVSAGALTTKIASGLVGAGTQISLTVTTSTGVVSNQVNATVP